MDIREVSVVKGTKLHTVTELTIGTVYLFLKELVDKKIVKKSLKSRQDFVAYKTLECDLPNHVSLKHRKPFNVIKFGVKKYLFGLKNQGNMTSNRTLLVDVNTFYEYLKADKKDTRTLTGLVSMTNFRNFLKRVRKMPLLGRSIMNDKLIVDLEEGEEEEEEEEEEDSFKEPVLSKYKRKRKEETQNGEDDEEPPVEKQDMVVQPEKKPRIDTNRQIVETMLESIVKSNPDLNPFTRIIKDQFNEIITKLSQ